MTRSIFDSPRNVAARMGRWSANHRKTAIFGWLAFVIAAVVIGTAVGQVSIDQQDTQRRPGAPGRPDPQSRPASRSPGR